MKWAGPPSIRRRTDGKAPTVAALEIALEDLAQEVRPKAHQSMFWRGLDCRDFGL